ncbi:MAG: DNA-processing protein DprA [Heliobacteriaceae bacterium]|nr:DNA-processing protein DprA [Heliobacteriaceae bacterium]
MDRYWVWLTRIKGVGPVNQKRLLEKFPSPEAVFYATPLELAKAGLRADMVRAVQTAQCPRILAAAAQIAREAAAIGIRILTYSDPRYPVAAKTLPAAPVVLYYRGRLGPALPGVAIVGSRRCTAYGKDVAVQAATFLARQGIPVVSGMAKGIDSYAQTACLKAGGYTVAVLGHGPDFCYPREHQTLFERIIADGLVLSAYPPGTPPKKEFFPARNNVISAWSHTVLVVEAGEKSGALLTAQYAREANRRVLAVPGSIFSPESRGTNQLLAAGVPPYLDPAQLLPEISTIPKAPAATTTRNPAKPPGPTPQLTPLPPRQAQICRLVAGGPQPVETLATTLAIPNPDLLDELCQMELAGLIRLQGSLVTAV